jgi:phosphoribosylanthranilate isomerase
VRAKICGITDIAAARAAAEGGAAYVGFVFYPRSPRHLTPARAAELATVLPPGVGRVAVVVDADDETLDAIVSSGAVDMLQCHGHEDVARLRALKARYGVPLIKAVPVSTAADLDAAFAFAESADLLLFDAKPPTSGAQTRPGGNGLAFDWRLLGEGRTWPLPWLLSGGLDVANVAEAVRRSGARLVDVSSGVEQRPGVKDPALILAFLRALRALDQAGQTGQD